MKFGFTKTITIAAMAAFLGACISGCMSSGGDDAAPAAPAPKTVVPSAPAPKTAPAAAVPAQPAEPKAEPAPAPAVPAPETKPAEEVVPAPAPAAAEQPRPASLKFRCTYWKRPANAPVYFVRVDGKYSRCQILELSFPNAISPDLNADGSFTFFRKVGDDYVPEFSVDPAGKKEFGLVILPKFDPREPDPRLIQIFDFDEKEFPFGTIQIVNWTKSPLTGTLSLNKREDLSPLEFALTRGDRYVSKVIPEEDNICNVRFFDESGKCVYSSGIKLFRSRRTVLFVLEPDDGEEHSSAQFDFRACHIY